MGVGFNRSGSSDSYVLLGGGGHKLISDFAGASHSHNYLPLSGGTISGNLAVTGYDTFGQGAYMFNGYDLILRAASGSSDSGDVVFQNGSGTEIGRIWHDSGNFLARFSSSDNPKVLIHSGNFANYVSSYLPSLSEFKCYVVDANSSIEFTVGLKGGIVITSCPYWQWNAIFRVDYTSDGGASIIAGGGDQSNLYWVEVYHTGWYNISLTTHEVVNYGHKCYVYAFMAA